MIKQNTLWKKNFTILVIGQIISLFGSGILRFALPLYLLNITYSPALFGAVSAAAFLPLILLMPVGGIIADRINKRNIMVILDFMTAGLMITFLVLMHKAPLPILLTGTLIALYSITGLYQPTVQASVPALLKQNILAQGNGIVGSISGLANLLSPLIGGMLFAKYGVLPIIIVSVFCYIISAVLEIFMKIPHHNQPSDSGIIATAKTDIKSSMDFIFKEQTSLRKLVYIICILNAFVSALVLIALPVLITKKLQLSQILYGYSQSVLAFGGLLGGAIAGIFGKKLKPQHLHIYISLTAASLIPMFAATWLNISPMTKYALILVSAFSVMTFAALTSIMIITYIQGKTEENMTGKIMAFVMTAGMISMPLGQIIYGLAFQYLAGSEPLIILGSTTISLASSLYAKKIRL